MKKHKTKKETRIKVGYLGYPVGFIFFLYKIFV